ncbi:MAG: DUF5698 domain-containing protein [Elusimicrobiota bacterium]
MHLHLTINAIIFFIFFARIFDVSLGTMRIIFISKGYRFLAALFGFVEILTWITVLSTIMRNLSNVFAYTAYAGGFAVGTYIGVLIEDRLALGQVLIQMFLQSNSDKIVQVLKNNKYGASLVSGKGIFNPINIVTVIIERSDLRNVIEIVKKEDPNIFYSIQDMRLVSSKVNSHSNSLPKRLLQKMRKSK